jgi:hypothetical protein
MTYKALASGTIVDMDGCLATFVTCDWLVRVPSGHPEPDSEADCWREVECGARLVVLPGVALENGHTCENGHDHFSYEFYCRSGREAADAWAERNEGY